MNESEAKKTFSNVYHVYRVMGGDLVDTCRKRGIPDELIERFVKEELLASDAMNAMLAKLRPGPVLYDPKVDEFIEAHDEFAALGLTFPLRRRRRLEKSPGRKDLN